MLTKICKIVFIFLFTAMVFAEPVSTQSNLQEIKSEYKQKNYQKVLTISDEYLKTHPNDYDIKLFVALSLYQLNQDNKAEVIFKEILQKYPKYNDARYGLINIYLRQKKYKEAELQLNELKKYAENKENVEKYYNKIEKAKNSPKKS